MVNLIRKKTNERSEQERRKEKTKDFKEKLKMKKDTNEPMMESKCGKKKKRKADDRGEGR